MRERRTEREEEDGERGGGMRERRRKERGYQTEEQCTVLYTNTDKRTRVDVTHTHKISASLTWQSR